jgi:hypothetical protein
VLIPTSGRDFGHEIALGQGAQSAFSPCSSNRSSATTWDLAGDDVKVAAE